MVTIPFASTLKELISHLIIRIMGSEPNQPEILDRVIMGCNT